MSLIARVVELFQAKTHKLLTLLENPSETLDLSYEKMLSGLQDTKRHLAEVMTERVALERQISAAEAESARAEDDARLALQSSREDLARAALRHKQAALQKIEGLRQAHAQLVPQVEKLVGYQKTLEERIEKFRTEKEVMKSSYAAARAQVQVAESITGISGRMGNVSGSLDRAKDRVEHMQARADTMSGLIDQGLLTDPLDKRSNTERELQQLRASSAIEDDMARLRAELTVNAPHTPPLLEGQAEPSARP